MHIIQTKILELSKSQNLANLSLRDIARAIGMPDESPQKIKHHLLQLQKKGFLQIDKVKGVMGRTSQGVVEGLLKKKSQLFSIPIIGTANCGPATIFAEQNFQGFLRISSRLIGMKQPNDLFAIKADGSSMNRANINGENIEDGDFVIIDKQYTAPENNDVVLVIIEDRATIKRFINDKANEQVVLKADSSYDYEPIYLHPEDEFFINGKAIKVIKKPRF